MGWFIVRNMFELQFDLHSEAPPLTCSGGDESKKQPSTHKPVLSRSLRLSTHPPEASRMAIWKWSRKWRVDTFKAPSVCRRSDCEESTEFKFKKKRLLGAENLKIAGTQTHTHTNTQTRAVPLRRVLMLMCSERQRWCIRWSVEPLWVRLCCRVSSSRQTLLSRLCVGVSQGTGGLFCYETPSPGQ